MMDPSRDPRAPIRMVHPLSGHAGSGRLGPISVPLWRVPPGAPRSGGGYAGPACGGCPAPPRIWSRGERNATRSSSSPGL